MNLNTYQQKVIQDLEKYLTHLKLAHYDTAKAFSNYWEEQGVTGEGVKYTNHIPNCPHVCFKVPTAGGKTFIATNAIAPVFELMQDFISDKSKLVLWLVPSLSILEQTAKALKDPTHPYRIFLNGQFNGRVNVFERQDALTGAGFSRDSVKDYLNIIVMSFDALKNTNKDNRKAFKENGALATFTEFADMSDDLPEHDSSSLVNTIRRMRPMVIVDESHNANTKLSTEMLNQLNPSFVLDLTATPKENSNVISYVSASALVKEDMVKLPVIVYNKEDQHSVFVEAKNLRDQLEERAKLQNAFPHNQHYPVRPIVLIQAESNTNDKSMDYEKVRQTLVSDLGIPKEQIKIKTANIDELKGIDLLAPDCEVRYIITVNALKEGWDCSFAYILATFANRSSETDVTQLLGRVLRKPYARKQDDLSLECSYVITASKKFTDTLASISKSLKMVGFSENDYRVTEVVTSTSNPTEAVGKSQRSNTIEQGEFSLTAQNEDKKGLSDETILNDGNEHIDNQSGGEASITPTELDSVHNTLNEVLSNTVLQYQEEAISEYIEDMNRNEIAKQDGNSNGKINMNTTKVREEFTSLISDLALPQFTITVENHGFFDDEIHSELLKREFLLKDFRLFNQDSNIDFSKIESEIWLFNVKPTEEGSNSTLIQARLKQKELGELIQRVSQMSDSSQIDQLEQSIFRSYAKKAFYPVDDTDLKFYIKKIVSSWGREQRIDCLKNLTVYAQKLKSKIDGLMSEHAEQQFKKLVRSQKINAEAKFKFSKTLPITEPLKLPLENSLYETEAQVNGLELKFLMDLMALDNIEFWHRNLSRGKGFFINGFLRNHYPDFVIMTKNKNLILVETKGGDRDGSDSQYKLELGQLWEKTANLISHETGVKYSYIMVFEDVVAITNAETFSSALEIIKVL